MPTHRKLTWEERAEIGSLAFSNPSIVQLARRYNCQPSTVRHWLSVGRRDNPDYRNQPGHGRKRMLNPRQRADVRRRAKQGDTTAIIARSFNRRQGVQPSMSTIQRVCHEGRQPLVWKPVHRNSKALRDVNVSKRLLFCNQHVRDDTSCWVFLDAKFFYLYTDGSKYMHYSWQAGRGKPENLPAGQPTVFLFYAAVAHGWRSSIFFVPPTPARGSNTRNSKESFTSTHFVAMMRGMKRELDAWSQPGAYKLIMDHASQHDSKASRAALQEMGVHVMDNFPPQSWDINMIERVWAILDDKLLHCKAKSTDEWRDSIEQAWSSINQGSIDACLQHALGQMEKVLQMGGQWV